MISVQMTVMVMAMLSAGQREGDPRAAAPLSFEKKAEMAGSAPALCMMEWRIMPGLECLRVYEAQVPQLKGFPDELAKVLASGNERSRSAALLYLARLAAIVRQTAWLRDRDDGDDLFTVALGKHVQPIRSGLETALQRTKGNDRLLAAVAMLSLSADHRAALDALTDEMRAAEASHRHDACEWVGKARLAHPRLVAALAKAIADKDVKVRGEAVFAVAHIGPKAAAAVPAFFEWHKTGEALDASDVIMISLLSPLRKVAWPRCAELDPDGRRAVPMLIERLKHGDTRERLEGFACLAQFGPKAKQAITALRPYLASADEAERFGAAAAMLCINPDDPSAGKVLIDGVKTHSKAIRACAEITPKMKALVPLLIAALKDPAAETRQNAAEALGNMGAMAEEAIPHLAALVSTAPNGRRDPYDGYVAASALARIGKASIPALAKILATPGIAPGRGSVAYVLGLFRDEAKEVVPLLIRAVDDGNPDVRFNAAAALGRLRKAAAPARDALIRASRRKTVFNDVLASIDADSRGALTKAGLPQDTMNAMCAMHDDLGHVLALWALTQLDRE